MLESFLFLVPKWRATIALILECYVLNIMLFYFYFILINVCIFFQVMNKYKLKFVDFSSSLTIDLSFVGI
jgi:hypothetical protein